MRLYTSTSLSEKIRMVDNAEKQMRERQEQAQQQQMQLEQQKIQAQQQIEAQKMQQQDVLNQRDNEAKIRVAEINAQAEYLRLGIYAEENDEELVKAKQQLERDKLKEEIRQFDLELRQRDKESDQKNEIELKKIQAQKAAARTKSKS